MTITNAEAARPDFPETGHPGHSGIDRLYERLERIGVSMDVPKNFRLYKAGDMPDSCYLIKEGRVISFEYTYAGRQNVFSNTGNGGADSLILLPAAILGYKATLSFMTTMPSKLVRIRREDLLRALPSDTELAVGIIHILASKFVEVNERLRAGTSKAASWKLCNLLLTLANELGVDYDGKVLIKLKYSQQMMADYLHVNRTTVARSIKELTDSGLIERINDYYCIRRPDRLQQYMQQFDM
jgi:CRP/FNR family transcriptional regulator